MKKIFTLLVALVTTTALWAYGFEVDGIYYNILTDKTNEVEVTYRGSTSSSYSNEYSGSVTIPSTVTYNGTTYSVTSIGESAFESCNSLISVDIPYGVTVIKDWAFFECTSLISVNIPSSITTIGDYAFNICYSLTSITIPSSVASMGFNPFAHCSSLVSIVVNKENTIYDSRDNCNAIIETTTNTLIAGCEKTIIPNSVIAIGPGAFGSCKFSNSFTIPNSVVSIGDNVFHYCTTLTSVTISKSITHIGWGAFSYCLSLKDVICYTEDVPELGEDVFLETPLSTATLYVPANVVDRYKAAAQWKEFGTILPISQVGTDLENIGLDNGYEVIDNGKLLRNGQLVIVRDGVEYNAQGQIIKE